MSKTNDRPRGPEADVAARVALERQRRSLSAAELARRMTRAGCAMNQSAIHRIEQYDPPRRITVDELVAFAKVFDLAISDLLEPPYAAHSREVVSLFAEMQRLHIGVSAGADVFGERVKRLEQLTSGLDAQSDDLSTAITAFDAAFETLTVLMARSNELVRQHLRDGDGLVMPPEAPIPTVELRFQPTNARRRRAAEAVAGMPPAEGSQAIPSRTRSRQATGSEKREP